ncbi:hypothetical protein, partial [Hungatella hathewayi]|uniref:hypothetical protein n=1 Tax=Hungatella hathewayi TaxID=154046 RepID=UPI0035629EF8
SVLQKTKAQKLHVVVLSSCEPRKRKPALFPASPSPSHKNLGCVLAAPEKSKNKSNIISQI